MKRRCQHYVTGMGQFLPTAEVVGFLA